MLAACVLALALPFGPFRTAAAPVTRDARAARPLGPPSRPGSAPMRFAWLVYQATLSVQDGPRCAHAPTCSLYGLQAVRRHPLLGYPLAVNRLWRDERSSALRLLPIDLRGPVPRLYDPLDAADFWLRGVDDVVATEFAPPAPRQGK
jgi:hypothetical protein